MAVYSELYLQDVVENQGKLFDFVAQNFPDKDTAHFIEAYMKSKTRHAIDAGQVYVCTMDYKTLWDYFCSTENYILQPGTAMQGFAPDWIGEFYACYQWRNEVSSAETIEKVPLAFLQKVYHGLHDLDLELAVQKVSSPLREIMCTHPEK